MKQHKRLLCLLLCVIAVMMLLPAQAFAAGSIDLTRAARLTITHCYDGKPLTEVTFDIYLISTVAENGELTPTAAFSKFAAELDIRGENDEAWKQMAQKLEQDILYGESKEIVPTDSAVTDAEGKASFPTGGKVLTMGLYLVTSTRVEKDGYVYSTAPFMVVLPEENKDENGWNYAVEAMAKPDSSPVLADYEVMKIWKDDCHVNDRPASISIQLLCDGEAYGDPITLPQNGEWKYTWTDLDVNHHWTVAEQKVDGYKQAEIRQEGNTFIVTNVCDKPVQPTEPDLPQTGQLWWPVPVLLAVGLLMLVIGLLRRRGAKHED